MSHRVLVVDDNKDYARVITRILTRAAFTVVVAENPKLARDEIRREVPDLFILDLAMPEENGVEFCESLRRGRRTARVPILVVSAHPDMATFLKESQFAPDDVVAKPFDVEEFLKTVHKLVARADQQKESAS